MFQQSTPTEVRPHAQQYSYSPLSCPILKITRLRNTLLGLGTALSTYLEAGGPSNGSTEAVYGTIELGKRFARELWNFERPRIHMLFITGGLTSSPDTQLGRTHSTAELPDPSEHNVSKYPTVLEDHISGIH